MGFISTNKYIYLLFVLFITLGFSCHRRGVHVAEEKKSNPISFKSILNIPYIEVRRRVKSGLSFDSLGFQAEPFYQLTFLSKDSARILNPMDGRFYNFYIFMETDSIFNVARSYFKLMQMSKDSLRLQVMEVQSDTLHTKHSLVYMTFYSKNYLENVLHTTAKALGKPDRRDTLFIRHKSAVANQVLDSAFAARDPVQITSINPLATVEKNVVKRDMEDNYDVSDAYMSPEFYITINKAYQDFSYSFAVYVDDKGKMIFDHSLEDIQPEFKKLTLETMKGIVDGYLSFYLKVTPGSTLGIKHTSIVILNVMGRKG